MLQVLLPLGIGYRADVNVGEYTLRLYTCSVSAVWTARIFDVNAQQYLFESFLAIDAERAKTIAEKLAHVYTGEELAYVSWVEMHTALTQRSPARTTSRGW